MRKFMTAVLILLLGSGSALAVDDNKALPGLVCKPQITLEDDFRYVDGTLFNRSFTDEHVAVCPIIRDNVSTSSFNEFDGIRIYISRGTAATTSFVCSSRARNIQNSAVLASRGAGTFAFGNQVLSLGGLNYDGTLENIAVDIFCRVPPRSRIRGLVSEEDDLAGDAAGTDGEPE